MARYDYANADGTVVIEKVFPMGKAPDEVKAGGETLFRQFSAPGLLNTSVVQGVYQVCDATGCTDRQRPEIDSAYAKMGLKGEWKRQKDGFLAEVFSSKQDRKRKCESRGFYDLNAGYSDPVRAKDK